VRHDLGVGIGAQNVATVGHLTPQGREVLDDAVVHDGEVTGAVRMRVRVPVVRWPVGGPPGVAYAHRARPMRALRERRDERLAMACVPHDAAHDSQANAWGGSAAWLTHREPRKQLVTLT